MQADGSRPPRVGGYTLACRVLCSALVGAAPLYYTLALNDDVYHFLILVLLAPLAGAVLVANSLFCLYRYREIESPWISIAFIVVGATGALVAWHFLPQFRM